MTRWFVGVKQDGRREVFPEYTGADFNAAQRGYIEICGPYRSEQLAGKAARGKPSTGTDGKRKSRRS
jgi:hypothetical protein